VKNRLIVAGVVAAAFALPAASATAGDKDCSDFSTWKQAQNFYKRHGGPRYDPHRLDADHDGIACESLR
jgi:Excalibur calcium-binding domain